MKELAALPVLCSPSKGHTPPWEQHKSTPNQASITTREAHDDSWTEIYFAELSKRGEQPIDVLMAHLLSGPPALRLVCPILPHPVSPPDSTRHEGSRQQGSSAWRRLASKRRFQEGFYELLQFLGCHAVTSRSANPVDIGAAVPVTKAHGLEITCIPFVFTSQTISFPPAVLCTKLGPKVPQKSSRPRRMPLPCSSEVCKGSKHAVVPCRKAPHSTPVTGIEPSKAAPTIISNN